MTLRICVKIEWNRALKRHLLFFVLLLFLLLMFVGRRRAKTAEIKSKILPNFEAHQKAE